MAAAAAKPDDRVSRATRRSAMDGSRVDLNEERDEEKYIDLATLTAAIDRDAEQARAWFAQRAGALTATDRI